MKTSMRIDLSFNANKLAAAAEIKVKNAYVKTFSFIINCGLTVSEILCNKKPTTWEIDGEYRRDSYISLAREVIVSCSDYIDEIIVKYSGCLPTAGLDDIEKGAFKEVSLNNVITDELKALSHYSVWFPMRTSVKISEYKVVVHGCHDYFVVKGNYNDTDKTWHYGGEDCQPCNIIAYKRDEVKIVSKPYINIYYLDGNDTEKINKLAHYYREILDYYNGELYPRIDIPKCDMACLFPVLTMGGAYIYNGLMVTTFLPENDFEAISLIAHETAHLWCSGAADTWEDWLNETTAEWSALMYALEQENIILFNAVLGFQNRLETYKSFPPIKTSDGKKPEGVHHRGVVLLYEIYIKYGKDTIKTILQSFAGLENKNTETLLACLHGKNEGPAADMIESGLCLEDYTLLPA